MAQIVSTKVSSGSPQADGRVWVTELHARDDGSEEAFTYLAEPKQDFDTIASERSASLNEADAAKEKPDEAADAKAMIAEGLAALEKAAPDDPLVATLSDALAADAPADLKAQP